MVIGIIRIVLSGIILCSEIIRCQIKKQACAAVIAVKAADDLVKKAFHHHFFDHDPCPDAQAAAPGIPSLILRQFGVRKVSQKVWIRIHHFRIVFIFLTDRCAFGDVVFLVRLIKIAWKINRNVDFPGFSKSFIRLSANPHRKLRAPFSYHSVFPCHAPGDMQRVAGCCLFKNT